MGFRTSCRTRSEEQVYQAQQAALKATQQKQKAEVIGREEPSEETEDSKIDEKPTTA